jgi:20S proteasome subunit beta 1
VNAVSLAITRDGSSGGVIRLMNITADKNEREFIDSKDRPYK